MPEFQCRLATSTGEVFERNCVAEDEAALRRELENQDLMILDVKRRSALLQQVARTLRFKSAISSREFLIFNQELSALVRAGLPIVPSLEMLLERRKNATFKQALQDIRDRVKGGESLSEAFSAQGDLFPSLYAASLASGERSGELASVLLRFISYLRKMLAIQRRVVSAFIYPVILLTLAAGLVAVLIFFIIPKFNTFLQEFGAELPLITKILVAVAMFCTERWQILLVLLVGGTMSFLVWRKSRNGRRVLDRMKLRLPLVGRVIQQYSQNRFSRTLGTLQAGGIPLVTSLDLAARATGNSLFEERLLEVAAKVREGQTLWESLDQTGLLSDIAIQMIKVGESTGALEEMLQDVSDFVDDEIDAQLTRLVALVEPLMLVFMALVVMVMLLSIYLPLVQAYGGTRGM